VQGSKILSTTTAKQEGAQVCVKSSGGLLSLDIGPLGGGIRNLIDWEILYISAWLGGCLASRKSERRRPIIDNPPGLVVRVLNQLDAVIQ
jgi:hypothetical protein